MTREVQVQSKPTRAKRRSDVLYTVADNDNQSAAYIAYCLNYSAATVRRDLTWLAQNGYVTVTAGEWSATDKGREYLTSEQEADRA
jgi:DeoR/GlpR family transcriptional regulator of sugar metabolism